jgi:hypothetical protein
MIFSTTAQERRVLACVGLLLALGLVGLCVL